MRTQTRREHPTPPAKRTTRALAGALLAPIVATHALATPSIVLLDDNLQPTRAELVAITSGPGGARASIIYLDRAGVRREASEGSGAGIAGGAVALLPPLDALWIPRRPFAPSSKSEADQRAGVLVLSDGQRFPGRYADTDPADDAVAWSHPRFGLIVAPIDRVARITIDAAPGSATPAPHPLFRDRLALVNGDALEGFVLSLADPVEIETDTGLVSVPRARIARIDLAADPASLDGLTVWLEDGSVASLADARLVDDETLLLTLRDTGGQARYALTAITAAALDASRIVPLASLERTSQLPLGDRSLLEGATVTPPRTGETAPLHARDILIPEPMRVDFALPTNATRFAAVAELPRDAWPWGDCDLVVSVDGMELLRERLSPARAAVEFSIPARGETLTISVEPGAFGPINDRVLLRRAIVLTD